MLEQSKKLKKEFTQFHIYTIATGATIASGFFLLPGIVVGQVGTALPISYVLAAFLLLPGLLSKVELTTAMPRAGGIYYYLDRSLGPLMGTIGGFGTWIALILKTAFAMVGVGAYLALFFPDLPIKPTAVGMAVVFGLLNLFGAKKTGSAQIILVVGLLILLAWFTVASIPHINPNHLNGFLHVEFDSLMTTSSILTVSYMGLSKVVSIAEEAKDPEKDLPRGVFLAFLTTVLIYLAGTFTMIGVASVEVLSGSLTPVSLVAEKLAGNWGALTMTIAAILAFSSVANAGVLSASRYPLAMSRDHLLPEAFSKLNRRQIPVRAIGLTVGLIILCVSVLDPLKIAKLASAFILMMFALNCLAVIVMRESRIESYDPGYRSPFYPWTQIIGIILPFFFIALMGWLPIIFSLSLVAAGLLWYFYYAQSRVVRDGAIYHIFARLGERRFEGLDRELRGILKEKGLRDKDPFDAVVASAMVIDISQPSSFDDIVTTAAKVLSDKVELPQDILYQRFMQGTQIGATPVAHGAALPHLRLARLDHPEMVMVRAKKGVSVKIEEGHAPEEPGTIVYAFFFLISPEEDPGQHLRILAQIAGHVDDDRFQLRWLEARNEQELKELMLRDDRFVSMLIEENSPSAAWIDVSINDLDLPDRCLVAVIRRDGELLIPRGRTVLQEGDRLTIIGEPDSIAQLYAFYISSN